MRFKIKPARDRTVSHRFWQWRNAARSAPIIIWVSTIPLRSSLQPAERSSSAGEGVPPIRQQRLIRCPIAHAWLARRMAPGFLSLAHEGLEMGTGLSAEARDVHEFQPPRPPRMPGLSATRRGVCSLRAPILHTGTCSVPSAPRPCPSALHTLTTPATIALLGSRGRASELQPTSWPGLTSSRTVPSPTSGTWRPRTPKRSVRQRGEVACARRRVMAGGAVRRDVRGEGAGGRGGRAGAGAVGGLAGRTGGVCAGGPAERGGRVGGVWRVGVASNHGP